MIRMTCPKCGQPKSFLDDEGGLLVQCDSAGCHRHFLVAGGRPIESHAPPMLFFRVDSARPAFITGPHRCRNCDGKISKPLKLRRATIVHPKAGAPEERCRLDLYACVYFCPHCLDGTLLETPYYQWGEDVHCERCDRTFEAPRDDILHEFAGDAREGTPFGFPCPSCAKLLRCDPTFRGTPTPGARVVCRACLHMITVPSHGERATLVGVRVARA